MKIRFLSTVPAILAVILTACVTKVVEVKPAWTEKVPSDTETELVFLAVGEGPGNRSAELSATEDLAVQLRARFEDRLVDEPGFRDTGLVEEVVRTRVAGLAGIETESMRETDRYVYVADPADSQRTLYLLVHLSREAFERDLQEIRIAATVPVAPPEEQRVTDIDRLQAVMSHLGEARDGVIPYLDEMTRLAEQGAVTLRPSAITAELGNTGKVWVLIALRPPVALEYALVYPAGYFADPAIRRSQRVTIEDGGGEVTLLPPEAVGSFELQLVPRWFLAAADDLAPSVGGDERALQALLTIGRQFSARIPCTVTSSAAQIPTAVVIVETDIVRNPIPTEQTGATVARALGSAGFRIRNAEPDREMQNQILGVGNLSARELYDILPFELLTAVDRVVVGSAWIADFREDESVAVTVNLDARVLDLRRDRLLLTLSVSGIARGNESRAVIRAAFQSAGTQLAAQLQRRLP